MVVIAYTDGASSGNPGPSGIGVVLYHNEAKTNEISEYIGKATNNIAEYSAVIKALEIAKRKRDKEIIVRTDSQLIVRQLNGEYKTKDAKLRTLNRKIVALCKGLKVNFEHVPRSENSEADKLAKKASESGKKVKSKKKSIQKRL